MPLKLKRDSSSSCDSKKSEEHQTRSKPMEGGSQKLYKSTLDIDSINVIDECDEDLCVSPVRGE